MATEKRDYYRPILVCVPHSGLWGTDLTVVVSVDIKSAIFGVRYLTFQCIAGP